MKAARKMPPLAPARRESARDTRARLVLSLLKLAGRLDEDGLLATIQRAGELVHADERRAA